MSKLISRSGKHIGEITSPQAGDTLTYSGTAGLFTNSQAVGVSTMLGEGVAWGRCHEYNGDIYVAGSASSERIFGWSYSGEVQRSVQLGCLEKPASGWKQVAYTHTNVYALSNDGVFYSAGDDDYGQLGNGGEVPGNDSRRHLKPVKDPLCYGPGIEVIGIHTLKRTPFETTNQGSIIIQVNDNGTIKTLAAGHNSHGQLGIGGTANQDALTEGNWAAYRDKIIVAHDFHGLANMFVFDDGTVVGSGYNSHGQIGTSFMGNSAVAQSMDTNGNPVTDAIDVKVSYVHGTAVCAFILKSDGTVMSAGRNINGGLGRTSSSNSNFQYYAYVKTDAGATQTLQNIVKIEALYGGLIALDDQGRIWVTGRNHDCHWGNGDSSGQTQTFARLSGVTDVEDFWVGGGNRNGWVTAWYKKTDGTIYGAGNNVDYAGGWVEHGKSNDPDLQEMNFPTGENIIEIRSLGGTNDSNAAYRGSWALAESGNIYIWGQRTIFGMPYTGTDLILNPILLKDYKP